MTLPRDINRCCGFSYPGAWSRCPHRIACARYRDVPHSPDASWSESLGRLSFAESLNTYNHTPCPYFIEWRP